MTGLSSNRLVRLALVVLSLAAPAAHADERGTSPSTLTVVTWNLGYGGLGAESDFFADGGKRYLPPSRKAVVKNRDAIAAWLAAQDADVILTQETAEASIINYWVNIKRAVDKALAKYANIYHADFRTRFLPYPLKISNGHSTYLRKPPLRTAVWPLPSDGDAYSGGPVRKKYAALGTYYQGTNGCWLFINTHLAAFDPGGALRRRQLGELMKIAARARQDGWHVVIGADWNQRLTATNFSHTSDPSALFWIHDLPAGSFAEGWKLTFDPAVPTVRTNERAYKRGQNYTTIIDGFLVSPEVEVIAVKTHDLDFQYSDHQPVSLTVSAGKPETTRCPT
ncbi:MULTISPECIES: endonuclease/exonuclease/phosphatase family protein [Asticcacaulis]|uniref:endonuclease/exonuclease/phosphatase family protein n=1 Tax=Asticcacaulis TaxID=76890 RepID=UPI001AEB1998|nr:MULTISPECIES: endonuclease/exonuclease/phosphatase family protein [Asticcacaulis]MBP2161333.1 endonuclease/exonuclease/phosphatase family metal-dependent hydrolase [Asticcacaulis solisilvae]MDR6802301.1 endonuclease/exonuclease/phosphatase family metal-dependent hydrolase [Asticcacaulis sp. BE141]